MGSPVLRKSLYISEGLQRIVGTLVNPSHVVLHISKALVFLANVLRQRLAHRACQPGLFGGLAGSFLRVSIELVKLVPRRVGTEYVFPAALDQRRLFRNREHEVAEERAFWKSAALQERHEAAARKLIAAR